MVGLQDGRQIRRQMGSQIRGGWVMNFKGHVQHWVLFFAVVLCIAKFFIRFQWERLWGGGVRR